MYYSNIYRLSKFGILGPEVSHFTGRAAPGKLKKKEYVLTLSEPPSPLLPFTLSVSSIFQ